MTWYLKSVSLFGNVTENQVHAWAFFLDVALDSRFQETAKMVERKLKIYVSNFFLIIFCTIPS